MAFLVSLDHGSGGRGPSGLNAKEIQSRATQRGEYGGAVRGGQGRAAMLAFTELRQAAERVPDRVW